MSDIETRIRARIYQSPSRARAAVLRSKVPKAERAACMAAVAEWENEGVQEPPIVGGLPAEVSDELPHPGQVKLEQAASARATTRLSVALLVNLNAAIRAQLTPYGIARLYEARHRVGAVPADLLERGGWWSTTLAHFMAAMGEQLEHPLSGDVVTVAFCIELLDPEWMTP